ncbi:MAG: Hydroxypyruvate reductase [Paracidovorax wautersii]|uniref:Hydroxypyruvate reductase n=1 Tax=Paracidovorax wautersii TaxID=1177982 RepID=A0A7V8JQI2_9BURK|nr:MAG: Hydroxypyruvate reductase [Paracidovorax wautersii]
MTLTIASQWSEAANAGLGARGLNVLPIPEGVPVDVPLQAQVLLLAPPFQWGGRSAPKPPGWPFELRWIQLATAGIDFFPDWLFEGPQVTSARGVTADAIAEFALAAIFSAAKRLPDIWIDDPAQWALSTLQRVGGTTFGLVGFGAIAQALARRALALGMRVVCVRRGPAPPEVDGVERAQDLASLFAQSDHVVLAAPGTPATQHLVNRALLAQAKPGLHLINVARGSLIDQDALLEALDGGRVALATLDVATPEPLPAGHAFYTHPRVRLSPHTSPISPDTPQRLLAKFVANLERYEAGLALDDVADRARGY